MKRSHLNVMLTCLGLFITLISFSPEKNASLVQDVLSQTNQFRQSKGLPVLIIRNDLNEIAQKHSSDMAKGIVGFGHSGFEKRNAMVAKKINPMNGFGENVAFGASTGKEAVSMWKNSSGHRKNMLGRYRFIGIGIAKDKQGQIYYTQVFAG